MSWGKALNRVVSAGLLTAAGVGLYLLVPGSNIAGLDRAAVVSARPLSLDRNVYLYDGADFSRAGVVVRSRDGKGHALEVLDGVLDCNCLVATVARPDVRAFLRMQTPEDQTALREELSQTVLEFVGDVFALIQADPNDPTEDILARALEDALQSPDVIEAQSAVGASLRNHVGGDLPAALGGIFVSRVTDAVKVVVADASENYGLDLVRGEFDTGPLGNAVDGMLADPRFIEVVSKTAESIVADPAVGHAARLLAAEYAERLFDAMLSTEDLPPMATGLKPRSSGFTRPFSSSSNMSGVAVAGAFSRESINTTLPLSAKRISIRPPPPIPDAFGSTIPRANPTATAASTALPPACRISTPTWLASGCAEATIPFAPRTSCVTSTTTTGAQAPRKNTVTSSHSVILYRLKHLLI